MSRKAKIKDNIKTKLSVDNKSEISPVVKDLDSNPEFLFDVFPKASSKKPKKKLKSACTKIIAPWLEIKEIMKDDIKNNLKEKKPKKKLTPIKQLEVVRDKFNIETQAVLKEKGRPNFEYDREIAKEICRKVATTTLSLKQVCRLLKEQAGDKREFPGETTVQNWRIDVPEFSLMYMTAKQQQVEVLVDSLDDIANDTSNDTLTDEYGNQRANKEWIARSKLKIDTIKWKACKLVPRLYGDKVTNETTVTIKHEDALAELE